MKTADATQQRYNQRVGLVSSVIEQSHPAMSTGRIEELALKIVDALDFYEVDRGPGSWRK